MPHEIRKRVQELCSIYAHDCMYHTGVHYVPSFNDLNTLANDDLDELIVETDVHPPTMASLLLKQDEPTQPAPPIRTLYQLVPAKLPVLHPSGRLQQLEQQLQQRRQQQWQQQEEGYQGSAAEPSSPGISPAPVLDYSLWQPRGLLYNVDLPGLLSIHSPPVKKAERSPRTNKKDDWPMFEVVDLHKVDRYIPIKRKTWLMDVWKPGEPESIWDYVIQAKQLDKSSFHDLDKDRKGYIDVHDLKALAGGNNALVSDLMREADQNANGKLEQHEFDAIIDRFNQKHGRD